MELYLCSLVLGLLLLVPLVLKTFFPYVWLDVSFVVDILRIFVAFVSRRRRKPTFFALDRFLEQVAAVPEKPFVVFGDESFTFALADEQSNRIANALRAHPGYTAGDTVALFMGNEPAFVTTWLALAKLGSPVALLNSNIRSKSLLHCFSCCKATVLIAASELRNAVEDVLSSLTERGTTILLMSKHCDTPGIQGFSALVEDASVAPLPRSLRSHITYKSPAVYIYTSGTTGLPKAAVLNQNRLLSALAVLSSNGITSKDVFYLNLPLYHTAGFIVGFIGCIETGSTIILKKKWKGENVATTEVSDILTLSGCLQEANVYGVQVPGHEGRIGMAAVTLKNDAELDGRRMYQHVVSYLPSYARPRFIRIQDAMEVTGPFKQMKVKLMEQGFDPGSIQDPLYILDDRAESYVLLTDDIYKSIMSGNIKL
ncbi:hypothetical protein OJAV_G00020840 [Oryzias javanicus]|uniref:long-chain-fatty-acid--CoA ligase n=1 Tax=Oryzias javanicus TaxID=123683 RepID=A0A3S2PRT2_ORYJA|nr:hypothetical protein OJAV_G00020840 [Oryzias javanicus]